MIKQQAAQARRASVRMAAFSGEVKNQALAEIARALEGHEQAIAAANQSDLARAEQEKIGQVLLKRLKFDASKIRLSIAGIESLIKLNDPVGETLRSMELDKGLELYQVSCPIGVLGIVFESRPDALIQISTLALKSGNAVLLKGGSEAIETNRVLAEVIVEATDKAGLPRGWLTLLETREDVREMLALDDFIDLVIPRGSNAFVKYIMDNTRIMVLGHADGICHVYVDSAAEMGKAVNIAFDSKCQYAAVCNAMETLLVDKVVAREFLPRIKGAYDRAGVQLRGDDKTLEIIECAAAGEEDWRAEYNDLILAIKVVAGVNEAVEHINKYGSRHTDTIVTEDREKARLFLELVDSANVFWNCSTRFSDGYRYGLGAEVGISTNKVHARGPVGLEGLVTYKWKLIGQGQTVAEYSGDGRKMFTHYKLEKKFKI